MSNVAFVVLGLFWSFLSVEGICNSFATKCSMSLGQVWGGNQPIVLPAQGGYYLTFTPPEQGSTVDIALSIFYGDVDIYVARGREPTAADYDYASDEGDYLRVVYSSPEQKRPPTNVLILPSRASSLTGALIARDAPTTLVAGIPLTLHAYANSNTYSLRGVCKANSSISVTDGLLSLRIAGSGRTLTSNGAMVFTPTTSELNKAFDLTVTSNASLTTVVYDELITTSTLPVHLLGGVPVHDRVADSTSRYYTFSVPVNSLDDLTFVLTTLSGDADLYINPTTFYHRGIDPLPVWTSARPSGADIVEVNHGHPSALRTAGDYAISVYGSGDAEYILTASMSNALNQLTEGMPAAGFLRRGHYRYYKYSHPGEVVFDVLPSSGDADLMVSCLSNPTGNDSGIPSRIHYNYSSQSYWEDTLTCNSCNGHYYLAVFAFLDTTYTLQVMHATSMTLLLPGFPSTGNLLTRMGASYRIIQGYQAQSLTVTLQSLQGDVDVYLSLTGPASFSRYDYKSINTGRSADIITVPEAAMCSNCVVYLWLYAVTTSKYSLTASFEDGTISLTSLLPFRGTVAEGQIEYYSFIPSSNTVVVTLTCLSGLSGLLVSDRLLPNMTSPLTSRSAVDAVVPKVTYTTTSASVMNIGVYGSNASYMIRVYEATTPPPLLQLLEGVPQADSIVYGEDDDWIYYAIPLGVGHEELNVKMVETIGEVDLYIRPCLGTTVSACSAASALPSFANYTLTTEGQEGDSITIHRKDTVPTVYLIGVTSSSFFSAYQISFVIGHGIVELTAGVASLDHVRPGEVDYYAFFFDESQGSVRFALTTASGDPDLFVSTTYTHPSAQNSTWRAQRYGSDMIEIFPGASVGAPGCYHCTYYLAVTGLTESTYTLVASIMATVTSLQDGLTQSGQVGLGGWVYYAFTPGSASNRDYKINLVSTSGNADLYVTLDGTKPTITHHDYASSHWFTSDEVAIHHDDPAYLGCGSTSTTGCVVRIAVFGTLSTSYTITLTSNSSSTLLPLSVPTSGSVAEHERTLYRVMPSMSSSLAPYTLRISAIPTSGHVSIALTCVQDPIPWPPGASSAVWYLSPAEVGRTLDVPSMAFLDAGCLPSNEVFYLAVYGDTAAVFTITAEVVSESSVSQLIPSVPSSGTVGSGKLNYYYFPAQGISTTDQVELRVMLTVLQGDADIYLGSTWEARPVVDHGQVSSYMLRSANIGNDDMLIPRPVLQDICANRVSTCYLIIAVFGADASASPYTLSLGYLDSTVSLVNGIPRSGNLKPRRSDYYVFQLLQQGVDVQISLTALAGDPDLFIGMGAAHHPNPTNYTWAHMSIGADAITLQAEDIHRYCSPDPVSGRGCNIYIGVFGWSNCSYSLTATVDDGFLSPSLLLDGVPASGNVAQGGLRYYRYLVSVDPAGLSFLMNVHFLLSPTDGGDVDLYLKFGNSSLAPTDPILEPGPHSYDLHSAGWSGAVEEIIITPDTPGYCTSCTIYLAVYGYNAGGYTLQGSSNGVHTLLPSRALSGHVFQGEWAYYSFTIADPFAVISVLLTTLQGDGDLYLTTTKHSGSDLVTADLPSSAHYTLRSLNYGSDSLSMDYTHPDYCTACLYLLGVNGFRNTTFTLLMTTAVDTVVRLVPSRPQNGELDITGELAYYSAPITSSVEDVTIALTSSIGTADLYVAVWNSTMYNTHSKNHSWLPDPRRPSSYSLTTAGSQDDHLIVAGPLPEDSIAVVAVKALSSVRYSIVASVSTTPVLLVEGIPQAHFVGGGDNALFVYYPDGQSLDLRITITARSGDPDLFVSSAFSNPHCTPGSTNSWDVHCGNYTWTSRQFSSDQIVISASAPCEPVLSSTYVDPSCDPATAYNPQARQPVYINVYGYSAARFSVLAVPVGQTVSLLPGVPQPSTTSLGYACSARTSNGQCSSVPGTLKKKVQLTSFSFRVAANTGSGSAIPAPAQDVVIAVRGTCNDTSSNQTIPAGAICPAGCACNPLVAYINSCLEGSCTAAHQFPSVYAHTLAAVIDPSAGTTLFLTPHSDHPASLAAYCTPSKTQDCVYYLTIAHNDTSQVAPVVVTARTPGDIALIPCDKRSVPDGLRFRDDFSSTPGRASGAVGSAYYEVCSAGPASGSSSNTVLENVLINVEQCWGGSNSSSTILYALGADLPSAQEWEYSADASRSCHKGRYRDTCTPSPSSGGGVISLTLPGREDNYYLLLKAAGRVRMTVSSTRAGISLLPHLVFPGSNDVRSATITPTAVTGNTLSMSWQGVTVLWPGVAKPIAVPDMTYRAFVFAAHSIPKSVLMSTSCGLSVAMEEIYRNLKGLEVYPLAVGQLPAIDGQLKHTLRGLLPATSYVVTILAECDGNCLRQVNKLLPPSPSNAPAMLNCNQGGGCASVSFVYSSTSFSTALHPDQAEEDDSTAEPVWTSGMVALTVVLLLVLMAILGGVGWWWYKGLGSNETISGPSSHGLVDSGYSAHQASRHAWSDGMMNSLRKAAGKVKRGAGSMVDTVRTSMVTNPLQSSNATSSNTAAGAAPSTWSASRPAWVSGGAAPAPAAGAGGKGYAPVRGQFTVADDEDLEVSL